MDALVLTLLLQTYANVLHLVCHCHQYHWVHCSLSGMADKCVLSALHDALQTLIEACSSCAHCGWMMQGGMVMDGGGLAALTYTTHVSLCCSFTCLDAKMQYQVCFVPSCSTASLCCTSVLCVQGCNTPLLCVSIVADHVQAQCATENKSCSQCSLQCCAL
jgi:hypothetical protein